MSKLILKIVIVQINKAATLQSSPYVKVKKGKVSL
jgi:hypothetical protein